MNLTFIESPTFSKDRERLFGSDEEFRKFQSLLLQNPRLGDSMPQSPGVRKVRFASGNQGKGKSGGLRILYKYFEDEARILLIVAYPKNEMENPSSKMMKDINNTVKDEREEMRTKP